MQGFTVQEVTFRGKHAHFLPPGKTVATIMDVLYCQRRHVGKNAMPSWESDVAFPEGKIHFLPGKFQIFF